MWVVSAPLPQTGTYSRIAVPMLATSKVGSGTSRASSSTGGGRHTFPVTTVTS